MPLHPPSAPSTPRPESSPAPSAQANSGQRVRQPEFIAWLSQFWKRITEGLELSQLWNQFKTDARSSYRFYHRDFAARSPYEGRRHDVLHTIQEFAWAILEKLSP